jgi:hypothetical protein
MGRSVHIVGCPRIPAEQNSQPPHLTFTLCVPRIPSSHVEAAEAVGGVLVAFSVSVPLAEHITDVVRIACHYLIGRSASAEYWILLSTDRHGISVVATDYDEDPLMDPPAWFPVSRPDGFGASDAATHASAARSARLRVHRTPDGHLQVGCRASWLEAVPGGLEAP